MISPIKIVLLFIVFILAGCYTQFVTLDTRVNSITSNSSEDSTKVSENTLEKKIDTIVIKDREVCYWHRTFLGKWELRCYRTNYSDYWHSYYNRPWWYHQSFNKTYNCHCPYHITFHPNCTNCWFHCDNFSYFNHHYKYKKKFIHHEGKSNSTSQQKVSPTNSVPAAKPKMKGPGKSDGRKKQGTIIVGKKPKQGTTTHIPKIPEKLIKQKQKAAIIREIPSDNQTDTLLLDTTNVLDTTSVLDTTKTDSTKKTILLKPKPGKHRSKRKY